MASVNDSDVAATQNDISSSCRSVDSSASQNIVDYNTEDDIPKYLLGRQQQRSLRRSLSSNELTSDKDDDSGRQQHSFDTIAAINADVTRSSSTPNSSTSSLKTFPKTKSSSTRSADRLHQVDVIDAADDRRQRLRAAQTIDSNAGDVASVDSLDASKGPSGSTESMPPLSRKSKFQTTIRRDKRRDKLKNGVSSSSLDSCGAERAATVGRLQDISSVSLNLSNNSSRRRDEPSKASQKAVHLRSKCIAVDSSRSDSGSDVTEDQDDFDVCDDISDDLDVTAASASVPTSVQQSTVDESAAVNRALYNVVEELVMTEQRYVARLNILTMVKIETASILSPEIAKSMFQNVDTMYQFHSGSFLPQLKKRLDNWNQVKQIGDIMTSCVPYLKLYTDYVTHLNSAAQLVDTWVEKNKRFAALVKDVKENPKYDRLTLQTHMLEPVQRVPRYQLLLREYLKKLPHDSEEKTSIIKALDGVSNVANHFESMLQRDARISELLRIQKQLLSFRTSVVSHDRYLVRSGNVTTINSYGKRSDRFVYLFNDLLLVCIERPLVAKYQVKQQFSLAKQLKVYSGDNLAVPNTFVVKSHDQSVEFVFSTPEEKYAWEKDILKLLKERTRQKLEHQASESVGNCIKDDGSTTRTSAAAVAADGDEPIVRTTRYAAYAVGHVAPTMIPKNVVTNCYLCHREFISEAKKHHCRACGNLFCSKCSSHTATLNYDRQTSLRVCDVCFVQVQDSSPTLNPTSSAVGTIGRSSTMNRAVSKDDVIIEDYLDISPDGGTTWVRRWFAIYDTGFLCTYVTEQDVLPQTSQNIVGRCDVRPVTVERSQQQAIQAVIREKSYVVHSDQIATIQRWLDVLSQLGEQTNSKPTPV